MSLYQYVTPESVPTYIRVMAANQITQDGLSWAQLFSEFNSGTYNNQLVCWG
jgi:hypothetical protein